MLISALSPKAAQLAEILYSLTPLAVHWRNYNIYSNILLCIFILFMNN